MDTSHPFWTPFQKHSFHHCLPLSRYILKFKFGYSFMGWVANALKSWKVGRGQKKVENPWFNRMRLMQNLDNASLCLHEMSYLLQAVQLICASLA